MSDAEAFPHLADFTVDNISEVVKGALRLTGVHSFHVTRCN